MQTRKSYCRICQAFCGVKVSIDNDRIVRVVGDREDPVSRGYACFKGLQAVEQHYGERRLLYSMRRSTEGAVKDELGLEPGPSELILREAGERVTAIVAEHGPRAVGVFTGTQSFFNTLGASIAGAFVEALQTPRMFTTMTIDQSAKWVAEGRMGSWSAGPQTFRRADVWMLFGSNPAVSMVAAGGANQFAFTDPIKELKAARDKGLKLIVIDPRRTETARFAALHLQPKPGFDAELAAAIMHVVLREGWHDQAFCDRYVADLEALQEALAGFPPHIWADRIGVSAAEIEQAAAMFARDGRYGMAGSGTGPDMARHSNLAEQLIQALNVVCGRFPRAGEEVPNPGVLGPSRPRRAEVVPPNREWEQGPRTSAHGLGPMKGTQVSAEIADEILHAGEDRLRALICIGGNLAAALPDQQRAEQALAELELLMVIDPRLSATARLADYVIAPRVQYERADHTGAMERFFQVPMAHATPALVPPPAGSDLVEDWYVFWSLARALGLQLNFGGQALPMVEPPRADELLSLLADRGRIPLEEVRAREGAALYPEEGVVVTAAKGEARFQLLADDVAAEITALQQHVEEAPSPRHLQLTVRRHRELMNSAGADFDATWSRLPGNPAYVHPDDLQALNLVAGSLVHVVRGDKAVQARLVADADIRPGTVSLGHCYPGSRELPWQSTNALVDAEREVQPFNRMPVMTGMYVDLMPVADSQ